MLLLNCACKCFVLMLLNNIVFCERGRTQSITTEVQKQNVTIWRYEKVVRRGPSEGFHKGLNVIKGTNFLHLFYMNMNTIVKKVLKSTVIHISLTIRYTVSLSH